MKVLIIGAAGLLGSKLAQALVAKGTLRGAPITQLALADLSAPTAIPASFPVITLPLDITDAADTRRVLAEDFDVIFHLAAVLSGQSEREFDTGLEVNVFGTLNVLEGARHGPGTPVLVFSSTIAVYGGDVPDPVEDWTGLHPQTSYGSQKAAIELLLNDYSRKGFIDGRGFRLPTISVRPGKPNSAASSFMSSIFREPLQGQTANCPVGRDFAHWYLSPRRCVDNLVIGAEIEGRDLGPFRTINMPGRTHRIGDMVDALRRVAGDLVADRITWEPDEEVTRIVLGWKANFNPTRALALGLTADKDFEENIRLFLEDDLPNAEAPA